MSRALVLFWLLITGLAPAFKGRATWYAPTGRLTAAGHTYTGHELSCAVRRDLWDTRFICGYDRGECETVILCAGDWCQQVIVNDTGAFSHLWDCSPAVIWALGQDPTQGVYDVWGYWDSKKRGGDDE